MYFLVFWSFGLCFWGQILINGTYVSLILFRSMKMYIILLAKYISIVMLWGHFGYSRLFHFVRIFPIHLFNIQIERKIFSTSWCSAMMRFYSLEGFYMITDRLGDRCRNFLRSIIVLASLVPRYNTSVVDLFFLLCILSSHLLLIPIK